MSYKHVFILGVQKTWQKKCKRFFCLLPSNWNWIHKIPRRSKNQRSPQPENRGISRKYWGARRDAGPATRYQVTRSMAEIVDLYIYYRYIYRYIDIYICMYIYICTYISILYIYIYVDIYICIYIYIWIYRWRFPFRHRGTPSYHPSY